MPARSISAAIPLFVAWVNLAPILGATAASEPWSLLPQAQVASAGVFLDQVVAGAETNAALHVRLCDAPVVGRATQLTAAQVKAMVLAVAPAWSSQTWTGAPAVQITRRMRMLPAAEVLQALTESLQKEAIHDQGELELRFARPWVPAPIADEPYQARCLDVPAAGLSPSVFLRFELVSGAEIIGTWQTPVEARLWRKVWVARQPLKRGAVVQDSDIGLERKDVLRAQRELLGEDFDAERGWQVAEPVNVGQMLSKRSVQLRLVVQKGQMVDALLKDGALSIAIKAEVLDPGAPGQIIRIRNPNSRRELRGKVINEQTVQLLL
ncbi:MAG: flagellar basal body P-ring formation protein FlgA [Verrucomicrobia bacterium]|nr:flagellar basal body P-ring formation protein FlgA [Verrucomicrobiota bacterium]